MMDISFSSEDDTEKVKSLVDKAKAKDLVDEFKSKEVR